MTIDDVMNVMGIPLGGPDVIVYPRRGLTSRVYSLNRLEESLIGLEVGNKFQKVFIIFACWHQTTSWRAYMTYGTLYGMVRLMYKEIGAKLCSNT